MNAVGQTVALKHWVEGEGKGPPLLLVHGGPGLDHSYMRPWLDRLARRRQLIFVDLRASGQSDQGAPGDYGIRMMAADLEALRRKLDIRRWSILGHSFGGFVAQCYARDRGDAIDRLVLASTSPAPDVIEPRVLQAALASPRMTGAIGAAVARFAALEGDDAWKQKFQTLLPLYFHDYPVDRVIADDRTKYRDALRDVGMQAIMEFDMRDRLAAIGVPTLVISGSMDLILPQAHSEALAVGIAGSELKLLPESGHFPFIEQQDSFLESVEGFLA